MAKYEKALTENKKVLRFIDESAALCNPDRIVWIDGSKEQRDELRAEACATGELIKLNEDLLPECYLHRTAVNDVARVEDRTFICCKNKEDAGPINNWMDPKEAYAMASGIFKDSMKGRTMYVIPYSMGIVGSEFAKIGIELTDSIYVVLNMEIMTRVGTDVYDALGKNGDFVKGLHSKCALDESKRYILHFPEDDTIWSCNSGYGGNVLLGKKCFALRIASYLGKNEGWMAEHMLILGFEKPDWIRVGADGRLWAMNPENGFFGVAPGTNEKSNPNALHTTQKGTIFTNVAHNLDTNTVWWEGLDKNPPKNAVDWKGNPWGDAERAAGVKGAHPNSRFTAPAKNCPCISKEFDNPKGVPLSAIVFGGRRAKTAPLVYQSKSWNNGVFVGSIMASETTAAATGAVGVVRRDPMAMRPFCGYNMGDYFRHWIEMGTKVSHPPKIFNVNWFRLDDEGNFLWPGFGENMRVLEWIIKRCEDKVGAEETPIGYVPEVKDIDLEGSGVSEETLRELLTVDKETWKKEADGIEEFYKQFGDRLPKELSDELSSLKENLGK